MNNNHSQTPAQDASVRALKKINELLARHWHLDSVGLGNCRAAQAILRELNEQLLIQSASLLANAGFDSNEPRDSHGQWATTGTATNRPTHANKAHTPDHPGANDSTKPKTVGTGAATKPAPAIAQDLTKGSVDDPFSPWFTFGVKTAGPKHVGPGGSFQFLGTAAGNNFYGFPPPNTKNIQVHP